MAIVVHCESCQRKIEAPDKLAGKRVKCPSCQKPVTIPAPQPEPEDDELRLAPLDDDDEARRKQLMKESINLTETLLNEKTAPEVPSDEIPTPSGGVMFIPQEPGPPAMDNDELVKTIIQYLSLMCEGELDQADPLAKSIVKQGDQANTILEQIALNQITDPNLAAFPHQVLMGIIRNLRQQIN